MPRRYLRYLVSPLTCYAMGLTVVLGWRGPQAACVTQVLLLLEVSSRSTTPSSTPELSIASRRANSASSSAGVW
jgi:hypothetical protein